MVFRRKLGALGRTRRDAAPGTRQPITLLVADTTAGLRRDTQQLTQALADLGFDYQVVTSSYRWTAHLRRGYPLDDLAQSLSLRLALHRLGHAVDGPILCGTTTAALLLPRSVLRRAGVRFDALAMQNRPGRRSSVTRWLERRWLRTVKLALPYTESGEHLCRTISQRPELAIIRLEPYVHEAQELYDGPRHGVLTYAANPHKKGLDLAVQAFSLSGIRDQELLVAGLPEDEARSFLTSRSVRIPDGVRFLGLLSATEYRTVSRRSRVYLGSSRVDEFATTQFEALSDGALLVTGPSAGVNAPLEFARRLDPGLVAEELSASSLGVALARTAEYDDDKLGTYRQMARAAVEHLSAQQFVSRISTEVLPALFVVGVPPLRSPA